ncbi:MAG: YndJ family protein [Chloroflexi bacterium]|nr:YndJ family protein [Chloroflexota bacterium]MCI0580273.1 YndJ family protein [Chloroflexota bacterium]MCI0643684.1 YndJ family protein [Chloroflexota bacterium]MCI0729068.1 YndJ family protein [Chloroflexota bacterium]
MAVLFWWRPGLLAERWAVLLLLLAALVLAPLALRLARPAGPETLWRWIGRLQLPAALLLVAAFFRPAGPTAAFLTLPWLLATVLVALAGGLNLWVRRLGPAEALCLDAGLVYLAIGGGWAMLDRLGARPLGFAPAIVLLTAVHFHYAGFVLPVLAGLAGRAVGGRTARLAALGVIVGVLLVAAGITATQLGLGLALESAAAWLTALAGLLVAGLYWRLAGQRPRPALARLLWGVAALSLAGGMALAALYGSRAYLAVGWLDIPWMRALHGSLNALGFSLAGLLAWHVAMLHDRAAAGVYLTR